MAISFICVLLPCVGVFILGVYLILSSRRRAADGPRCGGCGYNLTGATANRCPECGRLFIDAGVHVARTALRSGRLALGIALVVLPLLLLTVGGVTSLRYAAVAQQQRAAALRQAAAAQQAAQQAAERIAKSQQATTADAADHVSTTTSRPAPDSR